MQGHRDPKVTSAPRVHKVSQGLLVVRVVKDLQGHREKLAPRVVLVLRDPPVPRAVSGRRVLRERPANKVTPAPRVHRDLPARKVM